MKIFFVLIIFVIMAIGGCGAYQAKFNTGKVMEVAGEK
jgi:hypothetical protein